MRLAAVFGYPDAGGRPAAVPDRTAVATVHRLEHAAFDFGDGRVDGALHLFGGYAGGAMDRLHPVFHLYVGCVACRVDFAG